MSGHMKWADFKRLHAPLVAHRSGCTDCFYLDSWFFCDEGYRLQREYEAARAALTGQE